MCCMLLCDYRNSTRHMQATTRNTTMESDNICVTRQQLYSEEQSNKKIKQEQKKKRKLIKEKQQNRKF